MLLKEKNVHERDCRISLNESNHIYSIDNNSNGIVSVSTFIKNSFPKFNAKKIITLMRRKATFSTTEYANMTDMEIEKSWSEKGKNAALKGTLVHKKIENFYNNIIDENGDENPYFKAFLNFHETIKDRLTVYRTEWSIFSDSKEIAGQLDAIFSVNGTDEYEIYDWKVIKELKYENSYEKGLGIMSHLDNCNFVHYSLQLNIYKKILESFYGIKVKSLNLVILKEDSTFEVVNVADMMNLQII